METMADCYANAATGSAKSTAEDLRALSAEDLLATQIGQRNLAPLADTVGVSTGLGWYQTMKPLKSLGGLYRAVGPMTYRVPAAEARGTHLACIAAVAGDELLPQMPLDLLAQGSAAHIDFLVGSNR